MCSLQQISLLNLHRDGVHPAEGSCDAGGAYKENAGCTLLWTTCWGVICLLQVNTFAVASSVHSHLVEQNSGRKVSSGAPQPFPPSSKYPKSWPSSDEGGRAAGWVIDTGSHTHG